jgi:hypothetical protein
MKLFAATPFVLPWPNVMTFPFPLAAAKVVSVRPSEASSRFGRASTSVSGTAALSAATAASIPPVLETQVGASVVPVA